ncbi:MAG: KH domain-containing protein [Patescibacteria group bacterium]
MSGKTEITDQEFVESIVKAIVDHPEEVVTGRTLDERGVLIQLTVNREDMGKVIGREGRTAKAIRSLLRVFGARNESRINLKIVDPEGSSTDISEGDGERVTPTEKSPAIKAKAEATASTKEEPIAETPAEPAVEPVAPVDSSPEAPAPAEEKATGVF